MMARSATLSPLYSADCGAGIVSSGVGCGGGGGTHGALFAHRLEDDVADSTVGARGGDCQPRFDHIERIDGALRDAARDGPCDEALAHAQLIPRAAILRQVRACQPRAA